jgi:RNA polymerase sigma-70 factor (ECF subfamily)
MADLLARLTRAPLTPEDVRAAREEQARVRTVLGALKRRDAELLVLRSHGLTYQELARTLGLNLGSIGTLLTRAERSFRTTYVRRYGDYRSDRG